MPNDDITAIRARLEAARKQRLDYFPMVEYGRQALEDMPALLSSLDAARTELAVLRQALVAWLDAGDDPDVFLATEDDLIELAQRLTSGEDVGATLATALDAWYAYRQLVGGAGVEEERALEIAWRGGRDVK